MRTSGLMALAVAVLGVVALVFYGGASRDSSTVIADHVAPAPEAQGGSERPLVLRVGLTPYLSPEEMRREYGPLVSYLGKAVGIPAAYELASSYSELVQWVSSSRVHLAVLSPLAYVEAKAQSPNLVLLATQIADGSATYAAYIVARNDTGITSIGDLAGKRFGFVDRHSASGYLYATAYLANRGIRPADYFGSVQFFGNHARLLDAVLSGAIDGGATFSTAFKMSQGDTDMSRLVILAKAGRVPYDAYCASPGLARDIIEATRSALLSLNTRSEGGRQVLHGLTSINGFLAVDDTHYDEVRAVADMVDGADRD